ncbi:MAG: dicarboxylate/amino acid:cation symporter [Candidatus Krumholzibacteria bacterium]|jgi:Na+/H+-dicarboxylate symporter|nr:dicarboxylate/amino acid:cation symporter [Candidatus Krumholzibacteria bacterium]MDP6668942.1 dicarboxylate/amino acid:cation symporter [Candidatus Krumholzibacteria bacterium]MDP6798123.1 dicarboxylate/amino acid:cation symporter [Candidatus Krumholzibacteria bacterium]MDP7022354.1 dicarboxylate/amino acid:cation symporter [Candidatus Krumholzibacteria bacterium]
MKDSSGSKSSGRFILYLFLGMILGAVFGSLAAREFALITLVGDLFLSALKMLIIPLIASSMIVAVSGLGNVRNLGRIGASTLAYYLSTTVLAVILGLILVNLIRPGVGMPTDAALAREVAEYSFLDVIRGIIPNNFFGVIFTRVQVLPLIFFSLFLGSALTLIEGRGKVVQDFFEGLFHVSMKMTHLVVATAPLGVFALVASQMGRAGGWSGFLPVLQSLGLYSLTVLLGLMLHGVVTLPAILFFIARRNPLVFLKQVAEPLVLAFSTASSSATLPVTLETLEKKAGVDRRVGGFVLPLGATVNMDGTALYEAIAAVFIAQSYGIVLTLPAQITLVMTATLAAIGAAGIPQAGLVTMVMVLHSVGLPAEGIGMILAVDWFLDRCRTSINVWGDAVGAAVVEALMGRKGKSA